MQKSFEFRTIFGALIWVGLIAASIIFARQWVSDAPDATSQLAEYIGKQRKVVEVDLPSLQLVKVGDAVYQTGTDRVSPIGYVSRVETKDSTERELAYTNKVFVSFFGSAPELTQGDFLKYHVAPDSTAWVLQAMFPPEKREEISRLIIESYRKNQTQIVNALRPVVEASLKDASSVIREDLKKAFEEREDRIKAIGQRYQTELVEKEIVPLIKEEIWPIIEAESRPLASEVGQQIWSEVSVFRFGWRYLYDKTPLPQQQLTEKEFKRFVDTKAMPIMEAHVGDFVELQKDLLKKISANEKVKATMSKSFKTIVADPEVQELISEVFREVFVNNKKLQGVIDKRWNAPEAKYAVALTTQKLEPTITEIGVALFGSPDTKITPEFARVLRHRILHKDNRWFTFHIRDDTDTTAQGSLVKKLPCEIAQTQEVIPYAPARDSK